MLEEELQAERIFRRMLLVRQEDGASNAEPTRLNSHSLTVDAEDDILKVRSQEETSSVNLTLNILTDPFISCESPGETPDASSLSSNHIFAI